MRFVLLVAYPLLVHLSVALSSPWLQWAAMQCLFAGLFLTPLQAWRLRVWLAFGGFAAGTFLLAWLGGGIYALFVPALAMPGLMLSAFAGSLLPGRVPLVTRMATAFRGTLSPEMASYTRTVTWLWSVVIALLMLAVIYLMLFGPLVAWSALTNFGAYAVLGGVFACEYLYRRIRFRHLPHEGFIAHLRTVASSRIR